MPQFNQREYFNNLHTCPICLNKIGRRRLTTTPCNHYFHIECLEEWLNGNDNCPICRNVLIEVREVEAVRLEIVSIDFERKMLIICVILWITMIVLVIINKLI